MISENPKRLLCLLSNMNAGGAETFLMKLYRQLDKDKYQMDFCLNAKDKCYYEDEIERLGGRIYRIEEKSKKPITFCEQLFGVIKQNNYKYVLRITSNAMGFLDLMIAKMAGAEVCSARSSNSSDGGNKASILLNYMGRAMFQKFVDVKIAPSDLAAKYTFGSRDYKNGKVSILHNGIDLSEFHFNAVGRNKLREEYGVNDSTVVIGHIGRFYEQKNHRFLVQVFNEYIQINDNTRLILVGSGPLEDEIKSEVINLGIQDKVLFLGTRADIPNLLSSFDVFVFPSLYEGMPNTVIEAQAIGLPCIISSNITKEVNITENVKFLNIDSSPREWSETISNIDKERIETYDIFINSGYDIQSCCASFVSLVFGESTYIGEQNYGNAVRE